jgi:copper resistance protein C
MHKNLLFTLLFALIGFTLAHSDIVSSTPAVGATVKTMPPRLKLTFNEGVETAFSTFKVYAYTGEVTNGKLRAFANQKTPLTNDAAARADAGTITKGASKTVELTMKPNAKPGVYVVMWKLLSVDGHSKTGQFYFRLKP